MLNRQAFEHLVRAYSAELYRFAYWQCRDRGLAEDLVQGTFARAWTSRGSVLSLSPRAPISRGEGSRTSDRLRLEGRED